MVEVHHNLYLNPLLNVCFFYFSFFLLHLLCITILSVDMFPLLAQGLMRTIQAPVKEVLDPGMVALFNLTFEVGYAKASKALL